MRRRWGGHSTPRGRAQGSPGQGRPGRGGGRGRSEGRYLGQARGAWPPSGRSDRAPHRGPAARPQSRQILHWGHTTVLRTREGQSAGPRSEGVQRPERRSGRPDRATQADFGAPGSGPGDRTSATPAAPGSPAGGTGGRGAGTHGWPGGSCEAKISAERTGGAETETLGAGVSTGVWEGARAPGASAEPLDDGQPDRSARRAAGRADRVAQRRAPEGRPGGPGQPEAGG